MSSIEEYANKKEKDTTKQKENEQTIDTSDLNDGTKEITSRNKPDLRKSNMQNTRAWIFPMLAATCCLGMLVHGFSVNNSTFTVKFSLREDTLKILHHVDKTIKSALEEVTRTKKRDKCDPISFLVDAGFKLVSDALTGAIIDDLKRRLDLIQSSFEFESNISTDKLNYVFIVPPLLASMMFVFGFVTTLLPMPLQKKVYLLSFIEHKIQLLIWTTLTIHMGCRDSIISLAKGVPLMHISVDDGPVIDKGNIAAFILILALVELKLSQLSPVSP